MDDEIYCTKCPEQCQCLGYTMVCYVSNNLAFLKAPKYFMKGFILEGNLEKVQLHQIPAEGMVYFNA